MGWSTVSAATAAAVSEAASSSCDGSCLSLLPLLLDFDDEENAADEYEDMDEEDEDVDEGEMMPPLPVLLAAAALLASVYVLFWLSCCFELVDVDEDEEKDDGEGCLLNAAAAWA